jgi:DNA-binding NarL/FixJ family response regulator
MGRREDGKDNFRAGLDLLKAVRARDPQIPFVIFCSSRGVRDHRDEAMRLGANGITASATELSELLNLTQLKKEA